MAQRKLKTQIPPEISSDALPAVRPATPPKDGEQYVLIAHVETVPLTPGQKATQEAKALRKAKRQAKQQQESDEWLRERNAQEAEMRIAVTSFNLPGAAHKLVRMRASGDLVRTDVKDAFLWEIIEAVSWLVEKNLIREDETPSVPMLMRRLKAQGVLVLGGAEWFEWRQEPDWRDSFSIEERAAILREIRRPIEQKEQTS